MSYAYFLTRTAVEGDSFIRNLYIYPIKPLQAGTNGYILGCPSYYLFLKLEMIINLQSIDGMNQYNQVTNFWINWKEILSAADKAGLSSSLVYIYTYTESTVDDSAFDGRKLANAVGVATVQSYFISVN